VPQPRARRCAFFSIKAPRVRVCSLYLEVCDYSVENTQQCVS